MLLETTQALSSPAGFMETFTKATSQDVVKLEEDWHREQSKHCENSTSKNTKMISVLYKIIKFKLKIHINLKEASGIPVSKETEPQ